MISLTIYPLPSQYWLDSLLYIRQGSCPMKPTVSFNQMKPPLVSWSLCQSSFLYPDFLFQTTTTQVLSLYFFFLHPFISFCTVLLSSALLFCWKQLLCLIHFYSGNICRSKLTVWDKKKKKEGKIQGYWSSDFLISHCLKIGTWVCFVVSSPQWKHSAV